MLKNADNAGSAGNAGTNRGQCAQETSISLSLCLLTDLSPPANQIDKGWLTAVLKKNGALIAGGIRGIDVNYSTSTNSHIARIRVEYDAEARGDLPGPLILKTVEADAGFVQRSEVDYYTRDYLGFAGAPIPKCDDQMVYQTGRSPADALAMVVGIGENHGCSPNFTVQRTVGKARWNDK